MRGTGQPLTSGHLFNPKMNKGSGISTAVATPCLAPGTFYISTRLKFGPGHHRLEIRGPSNGRHKIAQDRPDFFAMLRSLPSANDDALDTLYEPNAVFSQFLGLVWHFFSFPFLASSSCLVFSCFSCLFFPFLSFFVFRFLVFSVLYSTGPATIVQGCVQSFYLHYIGHLHYS